MQSNAVFEKESLDNLNGQSLMLLELIFSLAYYENDKLIPHYYYIHFNLKNIFFRITISLSGKRKITGSTSRSTSSKTWKCSSGSTLGKYLPAFTYIILKKIFVKVDQL
jgi:hypothetical protein